MKAVFQKHDDQIEQTAWKKAEQQERENSSLSIVLVKTPNTVSVVRGDSCERVYNHNVEESTQRFRQSTRWRAFGIGSGCY